MNKCALCGKETKNPKFCSRSCSTSHANKKSPKRKLKRKCNKCDKKVRNYRSTLCQDHWEEYTKWNKENRRLRTIGEIVEKRSNLHRSSAYADIRNFARFDHKELLKKPCSNCGYKKHVELCHIKPISQFTLEATINEVNAASNVIQLCPNCHWEFDNGLLEL